jgi:putative ABC transport system permease protein
MLHLKIAVRAFLKSKGYNFLNIAGLALGLATFTFVSLYVANETSYDQWNGNADRIFLVERETPNGASPYTPGKLAAAIKNACPEVEQTGRMNTALFQLPFFTNSGRFLIKNWVGADYSLAGMLGIKPKGFQLTPDHAAPTVLLSRRTAGVLFPGESAIQNKTVMMMSRNGMPMTIAGIADDAPGNTNFSFDCIGFSEDITQGKDQSYANQIYRTFLLVKPGTDIGLLSKKIDQIYREAALADTSMVAREALAMSNAPTIFLDPLTNLHLKPHYGSHVNDQIVKGLVALALIILLVTGVNFTNLYVSQANRRSKEVGIKKVSGISRQQIVFQFLTEIFSQCIAASILSLGIVALGLPYFNRLLDVNLTISGINGAIAIQLLLAVAALTLLAGAYPAVVMAGFRPAEVLRGNPFQKGGQFSWTKGVIPVLQFTFAIGFVIVLIVINQQVSFMKSADPGFRAKQVLYIDNMAIYNTPASFESVNARIKAIPGVKDVAVSSHVPGGIMPASQEYVVRDRTLAMQTVAVGYRYFETLNIRLKQGQTFSSSFPVDSVNAVINETAAREMGLAHPVGAMIKGRSGHYRIIGVTKDVKSSGFESPVQPTVYLMNNPLGVPKTQIMISVEARAIPAVLATLGREWTSINKSDGDNFNYHFLDELYGKLYAKQEQLQSILVYFSILALLIASLGFFASAAQAIHLRIKEIAVRKVFGARGRELMVTLGAPFFYIMLIANLIAWPASLVIASKWLQTFAYRVDISFQPFIAAAIISLLIVVTTVCLQISRAVNLNLAVKLKE